MPYTLEKLQTVRERLHQGDILGASKPLNELIERYERMWNEYLKVRLASYKQHVGSAADEGPSPNADKEALAGRNILGKEISHVNYRGTTQGTEESLG